MSEQARALVDSSGGWRQRLGPERHAYSRLPKVGVQAWDD